MTNRKFALRNVRVFDGRQVGEPTTVVIDGSVIGSDAAGAEVVDAGGAVLAPGFIDAHVHLDNVETLDVYAAHGVTTAFDMGSLSAELVAAQRDRIGTASMRSAGLPIVGSADAHANVPGIEDVPAVRGPEDAEAAVALRLAAGADYIKILFEAGDDGLDPAIMKAVVVAAHDHRVQVVVHATSPEAYTISVDAAADVLTHVPLGLRLSESVIGRIAVERTVVVPTLTMMEGCAESLGYGGMFKASLQNVGALHASGVPVLAGSDANETPGVPFHPAHGASLHHELELLVQAGLSTVDALNAATVLPARHFGLTDRGTIAPGLRADLVLLDGDPVADIRATRAIRGIWCGGVPMDPVGN
ncbi:amidohydrolase family protein [Nocardia sp. SYP-A9097]|uniref:amidohydrolase family protein n=1 Tax=Nocardia sp. SYP-A9097 TaxID=2663237 RepID=UPI00129B55C2|nr:amidohydrolase family protein [Nocardia sp. SYP-A9097]MRH87492.1 amidohydrolase family protein [Nocardia sp. SYP-A9097]